MKYDKIEKGKYPTSKLPCLVIKTNESMIRIVSWGKVGKDKESLSIQLDGKEPCIVVDTEDFIEQIMKLKVICEVKR